MKKILLITLAFILTEKTFSQGCTVNGSAPFDTIVCGQSLRLSAFGQGQGVAVFSENFNNGSFGPGWSATTQATWTNPCSPNGVNGTTHLWMGNASPVPRSVTTASFNLSNCTNAGVTICFDLLYAIQGQNSPCEGPDLPEEGVYVQYSTNNGTTWITINYFDPNGGNDPQLVNWNNWCFQLPAAALTANTRFRWFQDIDSGADYDHWGIDNVVIYCNDPTFNIVWQHDGVNLGPSGGVDSIPVAPRITTSYVVVMSNGTVTCRDTVTLVVRNPTLIVDAGNDTTICPGQCAQLNGNARVLVSPAGVRTYSDNQTTPIQSVFGSVSSIEINVTGLNMTNILPNSITQVCLNNVFFFGSSFFPPGQISIRELILTLTCPDGTVITLVPANVTTGGSNPLSGGYVNTCFVPGGANIATGTSPYSGNFAPNQPFNNLVGCSANGIWKLNVQMNSALGFGTGTFSGWSITFNDPEISYPGNFVWSPTTNMTNSTTLIPRVCPPATSTYTITVSDSANCVTASDAVTVSVQPCCNFNLQVSAVQPSCAQTNGSINVTPVPAGNYSYAWTGGSTSQNQTGLAAGTYSVTVTDIAANCSRDTTIILNSNSTLAVSFSNTINPSCAGNDGRITVTLAGGTAPYQVTIDTGGTPVTITSPVAGSLNIPNLHAGTVSVSVTDAQGCVASATATLTAPVNCCGFTVSAAIVQPTCGQTDGRITITAQNGSGNYTYQWGNGNTTNAITNAGVGTYPVTITDLGFPNCFIDTSFSLSNSSGPVVNGVTVVNETCPGTANGTAAVNASGGTGALTYIWSNGQTTATATNLTAGTYNFTVTDGAGCQASSNAVIVAGVCCNLQATATSTNGTCFGSNNGTATASSTGGTAPVSFVWSNTQTTAAISNLAAGTYTVTATDAGGCTATASTTVTEPAAINFNLGNDVSVCEGITVTVDAGTGFTAYNWSSGETTQTISPASSSTYFVTVTDNNGCTTSDSIVVTFTPNPLVNLGADLTAYTGDLVNLSAAITGAAGTGTYNWQPDTLLSCANCPNPVASATDTIEYILYYTDANGCPGNDSITIYVLEANEVVFPDAFSPNGDRVNDVFLPVGGRVKELTLSVYNRWGQKIYETNNPNEGWDGTYKGAKQPVDNYTFYARVVLMNGVERKFTGGLTLIR
jgi:gliding motility-associated-like protein